MRRRSGNRMDGVSGELREEALGERVGVGSGRVRVRCGCCGGSVRVPCGFGAGSVRVPVGIRSGSGPVLLLCRVSAARLTRVRGIGVSRRPVGCLVCAPHFAPSNTIL
mgnify:CR=1 FL=1